MRSIVFGQAALVTKEFWLLTIWWFLVISEKTTRSFRGVFIGILIFLIHCYELPPIYYDRLLECFRYPNCYCLQFLTLNRNSVGWEVSAQEVWIQCLGRILRTSPPAKWQSSFCFSYKIITFFYQKGLVISIELNWSFPSNLPRKEKFKFRERLCCDRSWTFTT